MLAAYLFALVMFLWGLAVTPVSIALAGKFRILDKPGGRKTHRSTMPRGAGIVIWSGYLLWALFLPNPGVEVRLVATGASLVFVVGYMDDMHPLPSLMRLLFHVAAALWVVYTLPVPLWQRLLLTIWITGATSAYNFIDGMDGLCLVMTLLTMLMAAVFAGSPLIWIPLSGLVFGVFAWNFPSPRTFLGDGGSTLLGYICTSHLAWNVFPSFFQHGLFFMLAALLLLGGAPVLDTLIAMTRRILTRRSPFTPDRGHAHHKLLDAGIPKPLTILVIGCVHVFMLFSGYRFLGI